MTHRTELEHIPVLHRPLDSLKPSPENDRLYQPIDPTDKGFQTLVTSVRKHGVKEPILVTEDGWIISGHRRYAAARAARIETVPCQIEPIFKDADHDRFMLLLRECNLQRVKTRGEKLREEIASASPEEAYRTLLDYREETADVGDFNSIEIRDEKRRCAISKAKEPFLDAIIKIIGESKRFWPLSDRRIHYALLNDPPLIHASKPSSVYNNTQQSYRSLVDLLTRARIAGRVSMLAIADETRPVMRWNTHACTQSFLRDEMLGFLKGYRRNLMQSQPNHIEIVGEKNTIAPIIKPVAAKFCIPLTISRGFSSLPPRFEIARRYSRSGKEKLRLIVVSDFDPDGEEIAHSLARSLRDDFGIRNIDAVKAGLTSNQIKKFKLPPNMQAKRTSTNYRRFAARHGDDVYELEALPPETLQDELRQTIDQVIDIDALNGEIDEERKDAIFLTGIREVVYKTLVDEIDEFDIEFGP